ncbi:9189_t:CDS:2 [Funneliformis geosporum]|uniref:9189_t:CDS:1 n=1 Tax=Funneliformis geosporum TaxID=1117311 RepID=A0A9W4SGY5_9GLOM|nr:9189_t:CDS:2 [Funneliformis geosporum]
MDCDTRDFDFQKFKLHSVIGSGAFSSVYAACLKDTPSKFAIKKFAEGYKEEIILNEVCDTSIQFEILKGVREIPIPTTNGRFVKLYQKCWQPEPNERPEINQVISELNNINHFYSKESKLESEGCERRIKK